MADARTLERTSTPGVYRRHGGKSAAATAAAAVPTSCGGSRAGSSHKQMFATFELAREFKGGPRLGQGHAPAAVLGDDRRLTTTRDRELSRAHGSRARGVHAPRVPDQLPAAHPAWVDRATADA